MKWLDYLKELVKNYKWSKYLNVKEIFKGFHLAKYMSHSIEIPYKTVFELNSLYESLSKEDKVNFVNTVKQRFNDAYEAPKASNASDDLPF